MRLFFLFFSFFAASLGSYGQDNYVFENFSTKQGLISNETKQIVQDKKGFLWISSIDGISRFDGYQFVNHRLNDKRMYCAMAVDEQGMLWAVSDKYIYQYDESKQVFTKYLSIKTKPNYKITASGKSKRQVVVGLLSHRHQLWLATDNGLFRIAKKQLIKTSITQSPYPANLIGYDSDCLLLTTLQGTYLYNIPQNSYELLNEIKNPQSIFVDSKKQIWWGDMGYLYRRNKDNTVQRWLIQLKGSKKEYYTQVNTIAPLPTALTGDTTLWVGLFGHGIYQFNTNTETFDRKLSLQFGSKNGLSSNQVTNIFTDRNQNLWIASFNGIDKCDYHVFRFKNEDFPFFYELEIERLRQIVALTSQPHLNWVATSGNGLFLYDNRKRQVVRRFLNEKTQEKQSNNVIYEMKLDKNENLWISASNTLIQIESNTLKLKRTNLPLQEKSANSIDIDDNNNLGVGSTLGRVFLFNTKTGQFKELDKGVDTFNNVFDIAWDKHRKRWWLATAKGIFWCDAFMNTVHMSSNVSTHKLAIDAENTIWTLTNDNYLGHFLPQSNKSFSYKPTINAENFQPQGVVIDKKGVLWMNTFKGIYSFSPKTQQFQRYGEAEGLQNELSNGFLYDDGTGHLYLNHSYGYTTFDPLQYVLKRPNFTPQITVVKLNDSIQPFSLKTPFSIRNRNQNVTFDFTHLDFTQSSKTVFYYQLEGLDKEWKANGEKRSVTYINLGNGNYTFRVYTINSAGQKSPISAPVHLEIWQPFWEKPWFGWLIGFLLCSLGIWALLLYRYRQQLKLLQLRDNIARDLHDDMGSYLSSIQIQSQTAAAVMEYNPDLAQNMLQTIGHTTRHVMGALRDVVWAINPENDSFEQLLIRMKEMATLLLDANGIKLDFRAEANVYKLSLEMNQRKELLMIFKEAINNIIKHANAQNVQIQIKELDKNIQLTIRDDGQGFELNRPKNGNGLKNFQKRAQNLGGKLTLDSQLGNGTVLFLTFPSHHRGIVS